MRQPVGVVVETLIVHGDVSGFDARHFASALTRAIELTLARQSEGPPDPDRRTAEASTKPPARVNGATEWVAAEVAQRIAAALQRRS